jgi:hypothetical protein
MMAEDDAIDLSTSTISATRDSAQPTQPNMTHIPTDTLCMVLDSINKLCDEVSLLSSQINALQQDSDLKTDQIASL